MAGGPDPEEVAAQLKRVEEAYPGLDRISVSQPVGTAEAIITEQLQWFAEEVMPAFKGSASARESELEAVPGDD